MLPATQIVVMLMLMTMTIITIIIVIATIINMIYGEDAASHPDHRDDHDRHTIIRIFAIIRPVKKPTLYIVSIV